MDEELLAGRYRVGGELGSGGAATVYRAWDTRLDRAVAVKVFPRTAEPGRFDIETHTLAMLSHPGLVDVYDVGVDGDRPFIVLKLIEGSTLRARIAEGPMPVDAVRDLGAHLADTLAHVHARGVTHRDVKPSNVLLDAGGRPYLADFGVAKILGGERLTAADEMIGTAAYLAPEQVRGDEVGGAADVYALGLVLLECLSGVPEYDGTDVESAIARLHRPPAIPGSLSPGMAVLLARMTSLSPRRRPGARECADLLARAAPAVTAVTAVTAVSGVSEVSAPKAVGSPVRGRVGAAAGLVVVLGAAAGVLCAGGGSLTPTTGTVVGGRTTVEPPATTSARAPETEAPVTGAPEAEEPVAQEPVAARITSTGREPVEVPAELVAGEPGSGRKAGKANVPAEVVRSAKAKGGRGR